MADAQRYTDPEGGFDLVLPAGWTAEPNAEEGGVELSHPDGAGILHLLGLAQPDDEFPDPAEELYAFLEDQGVELEEDEVDDVELEGGEMSLCEYATADDEEGGDETFWMVGVATAPGRLVFATYFCASGEQDEERETVRAALATLRLHPAS
ncbi:MAG: hypothetical protein JWM27_2389 [Gemmatimonadetes bacterium]|nr:hypothetical protein [Gemmatimonadota bacterium]